MKTWTLLILLGCCLTFSVSCKKENSQTLTSDLFGEWKSEKIEWNGDTFSDEFGWINVGTHLGIESRHLYAKNYVGGSWELENNSLTLIPNNDLNIAKQIFKIISVTENTLVLETEMTEGDYCCDFEKFESDEIIRITEYYKRSE